MFKYIFLLICCASVASVAQTLSMLPVEIDAYQRHKVRYFAYDNQNRNIRNLLTTDFQVMESSKVLPVLNVTCPQNSTTQPSSVVIAIDVSSSMLLDNPLRMTTVKNAAQIALSMIDLNQSECAITSFDNLSYINQDFTRNRTSLQNAISGLQPRNGTDYTEALVGLNSGALRVAARGQFRKSVILITDGQASANRDSIVNYARANNITIYTIAYKFQPQQVLADIAYQTGGEFFGNVSFDALNQPLQLNAAFRACVSMALGEQPCTVVWKPNKYCYTYWRYVGIAVPTRSISQVGQYYVLPWQKIPYVYPTYHSISFGTVLPGTTSEKTLSIYAYDEPVEILGGTFNNSLFSVVDWGGSAPPFTLDSAQTRTITIRYSPTDTTYQYGVLQLNTDLCYYPYITCSGGYQTREVSPRTLRVTSPNGGENYNACWYTYVSWDGVATKDTVRLEWSGDNGNSWSLLQDNVTNTFEVWVPTPDKIGNQNKVRVSHLKYPNQTTLPLNHGHAPQVKQIVLNPQNPNYAVVCLVPDILMPQCRRAYVINLQTGDTVATLTAPNNRIINNVVWSSDGSTIYTCQNGTGGGQVSVWNASTYQIIRSFGESLMWSAIAVNPGGNRIVVGVTNLVNNVKVYDTGSGTLLQTISNHTNAVTACAYSQDGTRFATSDASGRVNIRNASTYQLVGTFDVSPSCVATSVNFNPTQTDHVVVSYDCGETKIWSTASQSVQQTITGNIGRHYYATYIANSTQLLICGELEQNGTQFRGASMLWNILAQTQAAVFDGAGKVNRHSWRTYAAAITPSGQNIITANHHGGINIWSITGAHSRQIIPRSIRGAMMSCDVTTNDQRVATLGEDGSVAVHSVQSRDTIRYCYGLENNSNRHSTMRFSPDGNYIAASSDSNDVAVWNSQTGALIVRHPRAGYGVCFTPNSQSYAIVSDSTVRFYATATGTFQRQITIANTIAGRDIQFNADGSQIFVAAIASGGRTVVVKANATNGAQILRFTDDIATNGECARLSYSKGLGRCAVVHIPTQRTYILDSSMQRIRTVNHPLYDMSQSTMYGVGMTVPAAQLSAWNTETGATIRTANPHSTTSINNAAIFSTNARSVSVGSDGNAFLWDYALAPIQADTSDAPFVIGLHNIVKKDSINWGQLLVRTQRDSVITQIIRNTGTSWGLVDSVRILGFNMIDFEIVNTSTQYYDYVYPGQQRDYELRFTPHSLGFKTAVLRIYMRCDTVNIILTGEAVNPPTESPMTLIDFGQVEITTQKDTTVDAIIKNVSNRPLSVTSVKIGAPDTTQFSITNGGGAFTLQPNQTRRMTLRFAPVRTGRTSAQLIMNHNGVASPATLQLAGEGVRIPRLQPVRDSVMLQIPLCSQSLSTDTIATLFSPGTGDAIVQSAEIIGADSLAFSIVNYSTPDTILATRSRQITVRLSTTQAAVKRAVLRLRTNAQTSVNGVVDIPLIGRRDTATLAFDFGGLQLLNVPPNTAIDTALYVNNTGTQPVQLTLPQTVGKFIIRSCVPNPIPPAVRARIAVRFTGGDTSSLSDTVYKVGLPCSATLQTRLQAYVQSPAPVLVSVPSIVANTNPCTGTLDTALILRNSGMRALDISRIAISGKDAPSIMLLRQPIVIPSNGADTILIRFTPPTDMKPGDEANATVIIFSNAANANSGSTVIPLRIRYAIMRHAIDTPLVDFTNLIPSTPATKQLTIRNTGSVPLPCVLPQQSGQFSITSVTPNPIPAGGTGVATVRFAGAPQGTLALDSIALTDGCNRSTVVQCRANVQSMRPVLATTQSQTFNVACVSTLDTVLVLRNLGNDTLVVDSMNIVVQTPLTVQSSRRFPIRIAANSADTVPLRIQQLQTAPLRVTLTLYSNSATGTQTQVGITLQKQFVLMHIAGDTVLFPTTKPNTRRTVQVMIRNTGTMPLAIPIPLQSGLFRIEQLQRNPIPAGDSSLALCAFTGASIGMYNENITFTDTCRNRIAIPMKIDVRQSVPPLLVTLSGAFASIMCKTEHVFEIPLRNIGADDLTVSRASVRGNVSSEYTIITPLPITVTADSTKQLLVRYTSSGVTGQRAAFLDIHSNSSNSTDTIRTVNLGMFKDSIALQPATDSLRFGVISLNADTTQTLILRNTGTIPYRFSFPIRAGVFVVDSASSNPVAGGDSTILYVRSNARDTAGFVRDVWTLTDSCGRTQRIYISAVIRGRGGVEIGQGAAMIGEKVRLPVWLNDRRSILQSGVRSLKLFISWNATLLDLTTAEAAEIHDLRDDGTFKTATIHLQTQTVLQDSAVAMLEFLAALGNDSVAVVAIDSVANNDGEVLLTAQNGKVTIGGHCTEGGTRLYDRAARTALQAAMPNPNGGVFRVHCTTPERAPVALRVFDANGKVAATLYSGMPKGESWWFDADCTHLPSGAYHLRLETPTTTITKRIDIVR